MTAKTIGSLAACLALAVMIVLFTRQNPRTQAVSAKPVVENDSKKATSADLVPQALAMLNDRPEEPPPPPVKKQGKPPAQDPAARAALRMVGVDLAAELIWEEAINNPLLPPQERQDLIEDLNEDGLPETSQLTRAHLPLIEARLEIISRLMPDAMDKVNADAFVEARKDLLNMRAKLAR